MHDYALSKRTLPADLLTLFKLNELKVCISGWSNNTVERVIRPCLQTIKVGIASIQ